MKKRLIFFFIYNLLIYNFIIAQNDQFHIIGKVCNSSDSTSMPFVTIQMFNINAQSNPIYSCITDSLGRFKIKLSKSGEYNIHFSYIGKHSLMLHTTLKSNKFIDLDSIMMKDENNEIDAINISGWKPLVKISPEKITYNVSDDPQSKNSNLLTIAEKIPILTIDSDLGVLLNNCKPLILINGKKIKYVNHDPIFYLTNTSASNILKIELITSPGVKYDSEGNCGVINIILKKQKGTSVMLGTGCDSDMGYNIFSDFGFQLNKLIVNGGIAHNTYNNFNSEEHSVRINKTDKENYQFLQEGKTNENYDHTNRYSLDISYDFDSLNTINLTSSYFQDCASNSTEQTNIMNDSSNATNYSYFRKKNEELRWGNYDVGINYQYISKNKKNVLDISTLQEKNYINESSAQNILPLINYVDYDILLKQKEESNENTIQINFAHNFINSGQYNIGTKTILRDNSSSSNDSYVYDTESSVSNEKFKNNQNVFVLYTDYSYKLIKNYIIKTGFRFEITSTNSKYINSNVNYSHSNYHNVLPYILISTKTSKGNLLTGTYNTRINRPNISALNPIVYQIDQQNIYYGNPTLTSEFFNKISFDYSNNLNKIKQYLQLSYSFSNNSIQKISGIEDSVYYTTYANDGKLRELNFYLSLNSHINSWMQVRFSGSLSYISLRDQDESNSGFTGLINANSYINILKGYHINLNAMYKYPNILLQGYGYNFYTYKIKVSKAYVKDKLNIGLTIANPFSNTKKYAKKINSDNFQINTDKINRGRQLLLSISYSLNNKNIRSKKTGKNIENHDLVGSQTAQ